MDLQSLPLIPLTFTVILSLAWSRSNWFLLWKTVVSNISLWNGNKSTNIAMQYDIILIVKGSASVCPTRKIHEAPKLWVLCIRVGGKKQKWDLSINPKFFSCLMVYRSWGEISFSVSDMFSWVELDPKFGILAFSAIFVLFFWVAKNLIYIDNAFNGYSYLKSTRKGLSDGTLMLKKNIV